jgi:hypothetical protein
MPFGSSTYWSDEPPESDTEPPDWVPPIKTPWALPTESVMAVEVPSNA